MLPSFIIVCPKCDEIIVVSEGEVCPECRAAIPDDALFDFHCEASWKERSDVNATG